MHVKVDVWLGEFYLNKYSMIAMSFNILSFQGSALLVGVDCRLHITSNIYPAGTNFIFDAYWFEILYLKRTTVELFLINSDLSSCVSQSFEKEWGLASHYFW